MSLEQATLWLLAGAGVLTFAGMVLAAGRVLRGPTLPDRVMALDLIGAGAVATICLAAAATNQPAILAVGLVMAVALFVGTCAFALYIQRRSQP